MMIVNKINILRTFICITLLMISFCLGIETASKQKVSDRCRRKIIDKSGRMRYSYDVQKMLEYICW